MITKRMILAIFDTITIICFGVATMAATILWWDINPIAAVGIEFLLIGLIAIFTKKSCMENDKHYKEMGWHERRKR